MAIDITFLNNNSVANITTNFQRVEAALEEALSRTGNSPNQMTADLDLNDNNIINVGEVLPGTTSAVNYVTWAEEWANKAEDSLVSTDAGGNGIDEYSAKHWAAKAEDSETITVTQATAAAASAAAALASENAAATSESNAAASAAAAHAVVGSYGLTVAQVAAKTSTDASIEYISLIGGAVAGDANGLLKRIDASATDYDVVTQDGVKFILVPQDDRLNWKLGAGGYGSYGNTGQEILSALSERGAKYIIGKDELILSGVCQITNDIILEGMNIKSTLVNSASDYAALQFLGSIEVTSDDLTADTTFGDDTISVADTTSYVTGAYYWLEDDLVITGTSPQTQIIRIARVVDGTQLQLTDEIQGNYLTSRNARLTLINMGQNSGLHDTRIIGLGDESSAQNLVRVAYQAGFDVKGGVFGEAETRAIRFESCINHKVRGSHFQFMTNSGFGYAIADSDGSCNGIFSDCTAEEVKHFYSNGGDAGTVRNALVQGNNVSTFKAALDTHGESQGVNFIGNTCRRIGTATDPVITVQGADTVVSGNILLNGNGPGIQWQPQYASGGLDGGVSRLVSSNNTITRCSGSAMFLDMNLGSGGGSVAFQSNDNKANDIGGALLFVDVDEVNIDSVISKDDTLNNSSAGSSSAGILINGSQTVSFVSITGANLRNTGTALGGGIRISNEVTDINLSNNYVSGSFNDGIRLNTNVGGGVITYNILKATSGTAIDFNGATEANFQVVDSSNGVLDQSDGISTNGERTVSANGILNAANYPSTDIADATHDINTDKIEGDIVWNQTDNALYVSTTSNATGAWQKLGGASGAAATITPS